MILGLSMQLAVTHKAVPPLLVGLAVAVVVTQETTLVVVAVATLVALVDRLVLVEASYLVLVEAHSSIPLQLTLQRPMLSTMVLQHSMAMQLQALGTTTALALLRLQGYKETINAN
jgi:hypothetical protein